MKYKIKYTSQMKSDLKIASKQHRNMNKFFDVVEMLANGERLPIRYRDHSLSGKYSNVRECHIEPDWLLVYEYIGNELILMLHRLGTHSELFKK